MHKLLSAFAAVTALSAGAAGAEDTIRIGFIALSTGQFAQIGNQMIAGARYFLAENGTAVAGKKVELPIKDDGGQPDVAKRIAQEFIVTDKVKVLAGFTLHTCRARGRSARDGSEDSTSGYGRWNLRHYRAVAVYRAYLLYDCPG